MNDLITSYLLLSGECPLKGIGKLTVFRSNAVCDLASKEILAPGYQIKFHEGISGNDDPLVQYISSEENCGAEAARRQLDSWLQQLRERLDAGDEVRIPAIGSFQQKSNGTITLSAAASMKPFEAVPAERVVHAQDVHEMVVGDRISNSGEMNRLLNGQPQTVASRFWITALILFLVAVVIIVLYFLTSGFGMHLNAQNAPATYITK